MKVQLQFQTISVPASQSVRPISVACLLCILAFLWLFSPTFFSGDFHRCRKLGKSVFPRRLPAGKLIRRQHVAAPVAQMTSPDIFPLFGDSLIFISRLEILDNFCEFLATI